MQDKVRLGVLIVVALLVLNSIILIGQAKNDWEEAKKPDREKEKVLEKSYESRGLFKQRLDVWAYTNDYNVYVENKGEGDYFEVTVYLKSSEGIEEKKFRKYIFSGEEERFYFREITRDKNKYLDWRYEVD